MGREPAPGAQPGETRLVGTSDLTHPRPREALLGALLAGEAEPGRRAPDFLHRLILLPSPG